jgi:hypothetical protein
MAMFLRNIGPCSMWMRRWAARLNLDRLHPAIGCWIFVDYPQPPITQADILRAQQIERMLRARRGQC